MHGMTGAAKRVDERARQPLFRKLERAAVAHQRARQRLKEAVAEARDEGMPVTVIADRIGYSRETTRKWADEIAAERNATTDEQQ